MSRYLAALLVLLALQLVPYFGLSDAYAVSISTAYQTCVTNQNSDAANGYPTIESCRKESGATNTSGRWYYARCLYLGYPVGSCGVTYRFWPYDSGCPVGTSWNDATNTCFDASQCASKPPLDFSKYEGAAVPDNACSGGCQFAPDQLGISLGNDDGTWTTYFTGWRPTGNACSVGDPTPTPVSTSQDCKPAPDNQTFCIKPDGQHCYSLTNGSGRQICWRPGETGEKASENALQVRNGGTAATTPTTPPPAGDSFAQAGSSITKTATVNGTSVTTTTTNFTTVNGTNTGGNDYSEPGDGSGAPSGGGGDGEGQGSASGGETCTAPPVCSGDPVGCAALQQAHLARCESKSLLGVEGADLDEVGGMMADSSGLWSSDSAPGPLDEAGFLSAPRICPEPPSFTFMGEARTIDTAGMCDIAGIVAALVLLIAFAQAAWIIGEQ